MLRSRKDGTNLIKRTNYWIFINISVSFSMEFLQKMQRSWSKNE